MTDEAIFAVIRAQIVDVLPEVADIEITLDHSMRDLGANSIDRMDVVIAAQDELGIKVPNAELTKANDLRSLVAVFREHASAHA
ncbi:phosphopantetheine-binding protein [Streptomyces sp. CB01635]|uniref:phosphopantetheine-binding protein n=1 Tax=unclassified Streptomyces TaxID=2593676 RepID=UPI000C272E9C|nr:MULTISPECIES: phosphopantetheine-binding protein [unclassified Streptomyces]PJN05939.1 phosphopantetheine-binding protein [Streptomyces sp. CB01635]WSE11767.1 phosphopantetheine-binding protein [Streptomyces sp. NBC_01445]